MARWEPQTRNHIVKMLNELPLKRFRHILVLMLP